MDATERLLLLDKINAIHASRYASSPPVAKPPVQPNIKKSNPRKPATARKK